LLHSTTIGSKQTTVATYKGNIMNSVNSKIELFTIALVAVAFAAAQVTAIVSIITV
jgi:hypothetical protein